MHGGDDYMESNEKEFSKMKKACEPAVEYLRKEADPHAILIVTADGIKLLRTEMSQPF